MKFVEWSTNKNEYDHDQWSYGKIWHNIAVACEGGWPHVQSKNTSSTGEFPVFLFLQPLKIVVTHFIGV